MQAFLYRQARRLPPPVKRSIKRLLQVAGGVRTIVPQDSRQTISLTPSVLAEKRIDLSRRRTFGPADLDRLFELAALADAAVPLREAVRAADRRPPRLLALRHDTDHDLENTVRLAEREAERGIRATVYVLHTDWYYRDPEGRPSKLLLGSLERIASLGHEIGLHNNAIAAALLTGGEPVEILARELEELRRHGFEVVGTVAHGDPLCRAARFVNNEVFVECARPELGEPTRTIVYHDPTTRRRLETTLRPVPMGSLGLEYEANRAGQALYLSDTGGYWSRPFGEVRDAFAADPGFLQVLVHPVWWALSGETFRPRSAPPVRPAVSPVATPPPAPAAEPVIPVEPPGGDGRLAGAGIEIVAGDYEEMQADRGEPAEGDGRSVEQAPDQTLKIIVRGDCCPRRGIQSNPDLFGGRPWMINDEKARTDFFLDHLTVGSPTRADVRRYLDVDRMSRSLRYYALAQTDRDTLSVTDADLLVMDDYSDMNFQAWRHRKQGWKIWIHPAEVRDQAAFDREFEKLGYLTYEQSLQQHVELIEHYRSVNGHVPVMYLHQPVVYYPKLHKRLELRRLGLELERLVPDLYFGDIDDSQLEPDDVGSCGPGLTLHFTGPTYRKMIEVALDKGLREWLQHRIRVPSPA